MNSGRDPDDLGEPRALPQRDSTLWRARWFRTTLVFSLVAASAIGVVPPALPGAAGRDADWHPMARLGPQVVETVDVLTPAREVERVDRGVPASRVHPFDLATVLAAAKPSRGAQPTSESGEPYWVQVGAYRDAQMAKRVAERLRQEAYQVQESVTTRPVFGAEKAAVTPTATPQDTRDRYEVVVTGSAGDVATTLTSKGLASQPSKEGTVVTPSLSLGEAVALSRELSDNGLTVRVRRVGAPENPSFSPSGGRTETLHRVRVGGFPDRAAALAAIKALESRGYKPFLTRGNE